MLDSDSDIVIEEVASAVLEAVVDLDWEPETDCENVSVRELVPVTRPVNVFDCVSVDVLEAKIE